VEIIGGREAVIEERESDGSGKLWLLTCYSRNVSKGIHEGTLSALWIPLFSKWKQLLLTSNFSNIYFATLLLISLCKSDCH